MIPRIIAWLQRHLPNQCLLCLQRASAAWPLCCACRQALPWRTGLACPHCAIGVIHPGPCGQCLQRTLHLDQAWSAWDYQMPLIYLLHQLKFQQQYLVAGLLGNLMAEAWLQCGQERPDAIIPVPLHRQRLRARGYNQAAAIGQCLAKRLAIPFEPQLVQRRLATTAQATLRAQARQRNVRGAFELIRPIPYQRVVLVDDVMTTGATLHELARTLKAAGVSSVAAWTACRAQRAR